MTCPRYSQPGLVSDSRVVPHDVAHVHLHGQLLQVDGKHHQGLPRRPLLARGLPVFAERRRRRLGHGIWMGGRKFRLAWGRRRAAQVEDRMLQLYLFYLFFAEFTVAPIALNGVPETVVVHRH